MKTKEEIEKYLNDQFGLNSAFVIELYEDYLSNSENINAYWTEYFNSLTSNALSDKRETTIKEKTILRENKDSISLSEGEKAVLISGVNAKIVENMEISLAIPTATSLRTISVKLLEENRRIINHHLERIDKGRISFSHIIAYAIVSSIKNFGSLNNSYKNINGKPHLIKKENVNLGIAIDIKLKDNTRSLIVPNIKKASEMNFAQFCDSYNDLVGRARSNRIEPNDFDGTTISLTNPGGLGTISSSPRLINGQGCIIAIGAIDYPSEFQAMPQGILAQLSIGKVMNITNTYDHRIIQGAESGLFLQSIDNLLRGNDNFYDRLFEDLKIPQRAISWDVDSRTNSLISSSSDIDFIEKQSKILLLVNIYRVRGHLIANLNPLSYRNEYYSELDPAEYGFTIWDYDRVFFNNIKGYEKTSLREILNVIRQTYSELVGAEFMHIQNPDEKSWLMDKMESVKNKPDFNDKLKKRILKKLIIAEGFEHFLHTKYIGHKRFSLEGSETLIPVLDHLLNLASENEVTEVSIGMAHRGRLNVLANIIGKSYELIFSEFEDAVPDRPQGSGDVKYHLGASGVYTAESGKTIKVSVASNPSHLEFVGSVVQGIVRAKQNKQNDKHRAKIIPILIHGDAAFAGQGVVAEMLNFSQLKGYRTGGTIHVIINNQIGFTTPPEEARSSPYATDVAKMVQAPIFHVNGDDPEAALWVTQLAFEYKQTFKKDVVIDLFGYRRHGHNEGDDPVYTQPMMYKKIKSHPSVKQIYSEKLISEGLVTKETIQDLDENIHNTLEESLDKGKQIHEIFIPDRPLAYALSELEKVQPIFETRISKDKLFEIIRALTTFPKSFNVNPKLEKIILKRQDVISKNEKIDWALAESLAFGSLLSEGISVRLSGQDSARGTFSQRHLILTDMNSGEEIIPLNGLAKGNAFIEALDSLLSESAVLGFEYGYSTADPLSLVMWEAQFGDFANGAQVIIDNFISSSKTKWNQPTNLVLLLPHGQEGQGPEHSSARIERFLILCAENNIILTNPTTPAQYFHILRKQVVGRTDIPLVIFTPKSLLRLSSAKSSLEDFTGGRFAPIIDDTVENRDFINKIILTSGKVYYDLEKFRADNKINDIAIIRIEQYYPLDTEFLNNSINSYKNAKVIKWVQEEPKNMGAWSFISEKLSHTLKNKFEIEYVGRQESSSPASGSTKEFLKTQDELVSSAFI